jgi:hypothetical protein
MRATVGGLRCATGRPRELLSFMRRQGESQGAWEGLLNDLYRRGLRGKHLQLIVIDGCPGLAGAIQISTCAASMLLGGQDAQHQRERSQARPRGAEAMAQAI